MSGTLTKGNPLIDQGTLNRIRGAVQIPGFPSLNVTAPYLGKAGISMTLEGQTTEFIDTLTGAVTSPNVYQQTSVVVNLLKTQNLAALYKSQMETFSLIGTFTVIPDATTLPNYTLMNGAIMSLRDMPMNGEDAGFVITLRGYYIINNQLFSL